MNFRRWTAVLLILCLAICGMTACKSKDEKKAASAGGYVEGAPEDGGDNYEIIDNQGGGNHVVNDNEPGGTTAPDSDTDQGNSNDAEQPGNNSNNNSSNGNNNAQKPDPDTGKEDENKPAETPNNGGEEEDDEPDYKYKEGNKIHILDYNLRCANDPEGRSIKERSVRFREVMKKYKPDVCGFQEIVPEWVTYLAADYPNYGYHIEYRSTTSKEGTMVMWNKDTMEELEHGHFWLSDTPDVMSKGDSWGETQFYRIVAWAKVKVKATGSTFIYYSTHQNNSGTHPQGSAKVINTKAKAMGVGTKFAGLCMGDYNIEPWTKGYTAMINNGEGPFNDLNADLDNLPDVTNHGYHNSDNPHIIDYIFYTPAKAYPLHYEVVDMEIDGNYVSDHRGLYGEIALNY